MGRGRRYEKLPLPPPPHVPHLARSLAFTPSVARIPRTVAHRRRCGKRPAARDTVWKCELNARIDRANESRISELCTPGEGGLGCSANANIRALMANRISPRGDKIIDDRLWSGVTIIARVQSGIVPGPREVSLFFEV